LADARGNLPKELTHLGKLTISVRERNIPVFIKLIQVSQEEGRSRSEIIADALREYLNISDQDGERSRLEQLERRVKELEREVARLRLRSLSQ